ncbi:hypothetical protein GCM10012275_57620 [Longimycelium tulufanense]|uniref:SseB protein N-terminal domain-containing protein n=1 Tax=Longimycelium tulufanense TaxID=907463 RepID=A0A8J3CDX0_9PSEU|nr:SseB family protein [Longimycelium tulufanense]GGM79474.1 hypothetical protein GCM10012275_57620 [Longimycelium tulufanense]
MNTAIEDPAVVAAARRWHAAQTEAMAPAERERRAEAMLAALRDATLLLPLLRDDDGAVAPGQRAVEGVQWLVVYSTEERLAGAEPQPAGMWAVRGAEVLDRCLAAAGPAVAGAVLDLGCPHVLFLPRLPGIVAPEAALTDTDLTGTGEVLQ